MGQKGHSISLEIFSGLDFSTLFIGMSAARKASHISILNMDCFNFLLATRLSR